MFKITLLTITLINISFIHLAKADEQICPENEFYTKCGDNCQTECATLNEPCLINYIMCPSGCYCNKGYARNDEGKCIPISECPNRKCPENEFYTECGENCQTECATLNKPCLINYIMCPRGCYCNKGYARNDKGKCIPISECPNRKCPENEFYTECGDNCQTECATLNKPCDIIHKKCPEGCYCNKGYARNAKGKCIPISECPKRKCPENEFYTECGDNCQTECATLNKPCDIIHKKCPEGCYCIKGYARNAKGKCIPISQCPKKSCGCIRHRV